MLPKIDLPTYEIKLPSTGKQISVRPFIVKEEKLLLMALESNDENEIVRTTKQIVNNCVVGTIDIDKLPFFDVDYIFIVLRAKSVGESIEIKFTCNNIIPETSMVCGTVFPANIDVTNCKIVKNESIKDMIPLTGKMSVKMRYPSYSTIRSVIEEFEDSNINMISECIDMIVDGDNVYTRKDHTKEEILDFIENLPQQQYKKLEDFVNNFPSFVVTSSATCPKCKFNHELEYDDFTSFFV